jgi:hypothetical protein
MEDLMPRKRNSTGQEPTTDVSVTTAEPTATIQAADPGTTEVQPGFADQVEKKGITVPDPFSIAGDYLAGVRLFESKRDRQMAIKFGEGRPEDKPSQEVIDKLKEGGFRWNPTDRIWSKPVWPASAMTTRINAERLFQDVCQTIRKEKGIDTSAEIPF